MNKHFGDAWYYLRRAGEHLTRGVREELRPAERKAREMTGREREPERGTVEKARDELASTQARVGRRVRRAVRRARDRGSR